MKHCKLVEFLSVLIMSTPCTNAKPPCTNAEPPYIEKFVATVLLYRNTSTDYCKTWKASISLCNLLLCCRKKRKAVAIDTPVDFQIW